MIVYGESSHTIRARTLGGAFARVRAFLERCTQVRGAAAGFSAAQPVTLEQIAADLAELDASNPMAGLNGYTWALDVELYDPPTRAPVVCSMKSYVHLLAHAGRLRVTLQLAWPYDAHCDEVDRFRAAVAETMGVKLSPSKFRRVVSADGGGSNA